MASRECVCVCVCVTCATCTITLKIFNSTALPKIVETEMVSCSVFFGVHVLWHTFACSNAHVLAYSYVFPMTCVTCIHTYQTCTFAWSAFTFAKLHLTETEQFWEVPLFDFLLFSSLVQFSNAVTQLVTYLSLLIMLIWSYLHFCSVDFVALVIVCTTTRNSIWQRSIKNTFS